MEMPGSAAMVAPLDGTPDDQGVNAVTPEGGKKNKSGGPRRKVGRWSEEETNTLIMLTNQVCTHYIVLPILLASSSCYMLAYCVMLI